MMEKSVSRCVAVKIEGVSTTGVIDTGSDITIIRGDLFYHIVEKANLKIEDLKAAQLKACTYDQKPIILDGQINMRVSLGDKTITTTIFVKLVAPHQLLLSESVCRQLEIVGYHPSVQAIENKNTSTEESSPSGDMSTGKGTIPLAGVNLISAVRLPAYHSAAIPVEVEELGGSVLIQTEGLLEDGLHIDDSINQDGQTILLISNQSNSPCYLECGRKIAWASEVDIEPSREWDTSPEQTCVITETEETTNLNSSSRQENIGGTEVIQTQLPGHLKLWAINTLANGTVCSNEHVKW